MSTTSTPQRTGLRAGAGASGNGKAAMRVRRRHTIRVPQAGLAALSVLGFALAIGVLFSSAGDKHSVLAVARSVAGGDTVQAQDLKVVRVATDDGLATIPASKREEIVGQVATTNLVPGSLLARAQVAGRGHVDAGQAVVGMALKPGQFPSHLGPGDRVSVVQGAGGLTANDEGAGNVLVQNATVITVDKVEDSTNTVVVSLRLAESAAARVASLASIGRVTLVLVSGQP